MKTALVILAAGLSSRMGVPKPLLPVGGRSALERALALGRAALVSETVVVTGRFREEVEAALKKLARPHERAVHNPRYEEGMFTSVQAGIFALSPDAEAFFLLPADCCAVSPDTLKTLLQTYERLPAPAVVHPACKGQRGHPPLIPAAFVRDIGSYDGPGGMRGFLSRYPAAEVETGDEGALLDMDTPRDYAALLSYLGLPTYPSEETCLALLREAGAPERVVRHSRAVRDTALYLAQKLRERGVPLDENLLAAAAWLHDIRRAEPDHAGAGARYLLTLGYPDAAILVARHMDWPEEAPLIIDEAALLYLADKLAREDQIIPLEETLRRMEERLSENPEALNNARRRLAAAMEIRRTLREKYGVETPPPA